MQRIDQSLGTAGDISLVGPIFLKSNFFKETKILGNFRKKSSKDYVARFDKSFIIIHVVLSNFWKPGETISNYL